MKLQIFLLSIFISTLGFLRSEAVAFGRTPLKSCFTLFPQSEKSPILYGALNRLLEQSNPLAMRWYQIFSKFNLTTDSIERFRQLDSIKGPRQPMIFAALELLSLQQDSVHPSLREAYSDITRSWLELWIANTNDHKNIQHLINFPHTVKRMFIPSRASKTDLLIQKQKLESFAELLRELKNSVKTQGLGNLSIQELVNAILSKPNPIRKVNQIEQQLLSLSKSRREEYLKTCLP